MRATLLLIALVAAGCGSVRALMTAPASESAPPGCAWVVIEGSGVPWDRTLHLCCGPSSPRLPPLCREAAWATDDE